ncbi:MAG: DMT family transporter [Gammaproteobacteria bacterium]|nr:DMT family transporter [Gammaproteobacteria bacterium]
MPELIRGILWMVFSGFLFVTVGVLIKLMESGVPAIQGAFIRYVFGMIIVLPLIPRIRLKQVKRHVYGLYVSRALVHGIAVMLWFFAMATIPLAEVTAIAYSTPIYTTIGAVLVFREHIRIRRVMAVVAGFVGTLIILRPGFLEISMGSLAQVGAAMGFAASFLIAKKLVSIENPYNILFMLTAGCGLALLPGALAVWVTPSLADLVLLFFVACLATLGHYAINKALIAAPLTATQPFIFMQMIWAIGFGYLLFGEIPDVWVIAGGLVILASITYLAHRENASARKQKGKDQCKAVVVDEG